MNLYEHKEHQDGPPVSAVKIGQETYAEAAVWCHGVVVKELIGGQDPKEKDSWQMGLNVPTMSGMARASETDYVVRDMAGAFHIIPEYDFESKFQEVGSSDPAPRGNTIREMRLKQMEARDG